MSIRPISTIRLIAINTRGKLILISSQRRATPRTTELVRNISREILLHVIIRAIGRHDVFILLVPGIVDAGCKVAAVANGSAG